MGVSIFLEACRGGWVVVTVKNIFQPYSGVGKKKVSFNFGENMKLHNVLLT